MDKLPLAGIRVADFSWVWAGPYCTFQLAMMGAEVIEFESKRRIDITRMLQPFAYADPAVHAAYVKWLNNDALEGKPFAFGQPSPDQSGYFNHIAMSKLGVTLDLNNPGAVEIAKRVVAVSDVVIENFAPRVMKGFGLDYETLKEVRPDIIYVSMSGTGAFGPDRDFVLYGAPQVALSGLASLTGYMGGPPMPLPISYADPLAALHTAFYILAALNHRRETGEGQYLDLSQWESTICLQPEGVMDYTMNGRVPQRMGNRDAIMAPHDVYPCKGDDSWIAIAVGSEEEWRALCDVMGNPDWTRKYEFADMYSRWQNQSQLDEYLSIWTVGFEAYELMALLQGAGVAATPSLSNAGLVHDPHLRERSFFMSVDHPATGPRVHPSSGIHLSETPARFSRAPLLGEHNKRVFGDLLGMSSEEIDQLVAAGVLY